VTLVSLQDLIVLVSSQLHDAISGVVTTAGSSTFRDSSKTNEANDRFNGSEILFSEPTFAGSGTQPFVISDFVQTNGVFTINVTGQTIALNQPYTLINIAGRGYPYAEVIRALTLGLAQLKPMTLASDETTAYVVGTHAYAIPTAFKTLEGVYVKRTIAGRAYRIPLRRSSDDTEGFRVVPGTRSLIINGTGLAGDYIGVIGEQVIVLPTVLDDEIDVDVEALVNAAVENLTRAGDQREQGIAAGQYLDRLRTQPVYRRPNSIALP